MALVAFQYEHASLDVNEVGFEEQAIPNIGEKSRKSQSVTDWCRCGKWDVMQTLSTWVAAKLKLWVLSIIGYEISW